MRRDFSAHTPPHHFAQKRKGFLVVLAIVVATSVVVAVWLKNENDAVLTKQTLNAKKLAELDAKLVQLKTRLAQEKKVRDEAAIKAKAASEAALQTGAAPAPIATASNAGGPHMNPAQQDIVVNKKHPVIRVSYAPNLVTVDCAGGGSATISAVAVSDFQALCQAAAADGLVLGVSSSYRSYATQISTYNHWVSQSGAAAADTYSARPGYSEHQTGFAIDFRVPGGPALDQFTGTPHQQWLATNAHKYGFIQRYTEHNTAVTGYSAETWHYRYIGRQNAATYTRSGVGSLEQFWNIPGGLY